MSKMKKFTAGLLCLAMICSMTACNARKSNTRLLGYSYYESTMNILRDQLTKAGFEVEVNLQPDYSSMVTARDTGEWDIAMSGWTTVTGNPDTL